MGRGGRGDLEQGLSYFVGENFMDLSNPLPYFQGLDRRLLGFERGFATEGVYY
jgi:hypothetical protein